MEAMQCKQELSKKIASKQAKSFSHQAMQKFGLE